MIYLHLRRFFFYNGTSLSSALKLAAVFALLLFSNITMAAKVIQLGKDSVKIDLEGEEFAEGDKVYAMIDGKKKAIIVITKVVKGKALGKVTKGKAAVDATIVMAQKAAPAPSEGEAAIAEAEAKGSEASSSDSSGKMQGAILAGVNYNMQSVKLKNAAGADIETASMSAMGFSLRGMIELPISGNLTLVGRPGVEQFKVSGTSSSKSCTGSGSCDTTITYGVADLLLSYKFGSGKFQPLVSGGLGLLYPFSKSSNSLDQSKISTTTLLYLNGGINLRMGSSFIPILVEAGMFPPSSDVTTYFVGLRCGYGFSF